MNNGFTFEIDADRIAWLGFNNPDGDTNVLKVDVLEAFDETLVDIAQRHPRALVVHSAKAAGFIAGADVKAFADVKHQRLAEEHIHRVHDIFNRLESLAFPTLAMIHGFCLGGGLELALACRYRIASTEADTRIGFPEVKLGIFPGYGGTLRSTRLIGDLAALKLMASGRMINARRAKRIGLIDMAVPQRQLKNAAREMLLNPPKPRQATWLQRIPSFPLFKPLIAHASRKQLKTRVNPNHYPAPYRLLEHWQKSSPSSSRMLRSEAKGVAKLITSDSAQQLIRVFLLQDRLKSLGDKQSHDIQHVHVVGGGIMGGDIAAWCALKGMRVTLQDRSAELLAPAMQRAHKLFRHKLKDHYRVQKAWDRLMPDASGDGVSGADVVIEAIFENLEAKQALFADLEPKMKPGALLASNTSSIPLEELGAHLQQPNRVVGLHFFNPVARMPLLEVVHTQQTPAENLQKGLAFARHIGKLPLPVSSSPGFLVNRILMPYLLEAVALYNEGISAAQIDKSAVAFGMPMGPIQLADSVGLDICLSVAQELGGHFDHGVPENLVQLVEQGDLGRKTGKGFYTWVNGKPRINEPSRRLGKQLRRDLTDRLIMRLVNESVACLREGVVSDADLVDAGVIFGTGFAPFRGGPLHYIETTGEENCRHRLEQLEQHFGHQFHADEGWQNFCHPTA